MATTKHIGGPMGRPRKFQSVEAMSSLIDEYFTECDKQKRPYMVTSLCIHLDIDRDTLLEYEKLKDFSGTIKKAKQRIKAYAEEQLFRSGGQVAGVIFNLKNNWGYSDKSEVEVSGDVPITINISDGGSGKK